VSEHTEIELKYLVSTQQQEALLDWLREQGMYVGSKRLENLYFDTATGDIQKRKMGLRIRRWPGGAEQTIKLAGKVQGAMSQRPEYNAPTQLAVPHLTAFPSDIWPSDFRPDEVTTRLELQFEVHFTRQFFHFEQAQTQIEMALDEGFISANGKREAILELELELKQGDITVLEQLAEQLLTRFDLQAGELSKAQRGFALLTQREG